MAFQTSPKLPFLILYFKDSPNPVVNGNPVGTKTVSYTHLDVYKRQVQVSITHWY